LDKFQCNTETSQTSSSQELFVKLNKKSYQFKKKGNKAWFNFICSVEDYIDAAKNSLAKMAPTSNQTKLKAIADLDQGKVAIHIQQ